jgi:hypothetical protein
MKIPTITLQQTSRTINPARYDINTIEASGLWKFSYLEKGMQLSFFHQKLEALLDWSVRTEQAQQQHHNRCIYTHHGQLSCFHLTVFINFIDFN